MAGHGRNLAQVIGGFRGTFLEDPLWHDVDHHGESTLPLHAEEELVTYPGMIFYQCMVLHGDI